MESLSSAVYKYQNGKFSEACIVCLGIYFSIDKPYFVKTKNDRHIDGNLCRRLWGVGKIIPKANP